MSRASNPGPKPTHSSSTLGCHTGTRLRQHPERQPAFLHAKRTAGSSSPAGRLPPDHKFRNVGRAREWDEHGACRRRRQSGGWCRWVGRIRNHQQCDPACRRAIQGLCGQRWPLRRGKTANGGSDAAGGNGGVSRFPGGASADGGTGDPGGRGNSSATVLAPSVPVAGSFGDMRAPGSCGAANATTGEPSGSSYLYAWSGGADPLAQIAVVAVGSSQDQRNHPTRRPIRRHNGSERRQRLDEPDLH